VFEVILETPFFSSFVLLLIGEIMLCFSSLFLSPGVRGCIEDSRRLAEASKELRCCNCFEIANLA
jgi:hypothetical protein